MEIIQQLFGEGKDLSALQMSSRAIVVFLLALVMIHIAGMRTFGKKSAFDNIVVIMLGAILSRTVVGVSSFIPTIAACTVLVIIHRVLALLSITNHSLGRFIKGKHLSLYKNGRLNIKNMKQALVSKADIIESLRLQASTDSFDNIEEVFMERSGEISVIKKENGPAVEEKKIKEDTQQTHTV